MTDASTQYVRGMLAMWVHIAQTSLERLDEAVTSYSSAINRDLYPDESENAALAYTLADYWQLGLEQYLILLSVNQVMKCVEALDDESLPSLGDEAEILRLLRHANEHWEDPDGRSLTELRKSDPEVAPGMLRWNNKHIWLGEVNCGKIESWLAELDAAVRARAAEDETPLPSPEEPMKFSAASSADHEDKPAE